MSKLLSGHDVSDIEKCRELRREEIVYSAIHTSGKFCPSVAMGSAKRITEIMILRIRSRFIASSLYCGIFIVNGILRRLASSLGSRDGSSGRAFFRSTDFPFASVFIRVDVSSLFLVEGNTEKGDFASAFSHKK